MKKKIISCTLSLLAAISLILGGLPLSAGGVLPAAFAAPGESAVYMTTDISADGVMAVYKALGRPAAGRTAIKVHMGEPGNTNYLSPALVSSLASETKGTFVDSNTAYGGRRASTAAHLEAAREHGFTAVASVDILDADGETKLPIKGGKHLREAVMGSRYNNYDFIISVAHFKGHGMAGFGGTFKNLAIGIASARGKGIVHSGSDGGNIFSSPTAPFLERIAEYTKAVMDDKNGKIVYINVLNNLSVDCDCAANAAHPQMKDIAILASLDPVALDKASVDLIYAAPESERRHLVERIESRDGVYLLKYAEELGLGNQKYQLVRLDG